MDFSKISYIKVKEQANSLLSSANQMRDILTDVKNEFNKIGNEETWSGTAASATKKDFDRLSDEFSKFSTAINECSAYLIVAAENYENVDKTIKG